MAAGNYQRLPKGWDGTRITVALMPEEKQAFVKESGVEGRSLSGQARLLILEWLDRRRRASADAEKKTGRRT